MARLCTTIVHGMISLVLKTPLPRMLGDKTEPAQHWLNLWNRLVLSTLKSGVQKSEPLYL